MIQHRLAFFKPSQPTGYLVPQNILKFEFDYRAPLLLGTRNQIGNLVFWVWSAVYQITSVRLGNLSARLNVRQCDKYVNLFGNALKR